MRIHPAPQGSDSWRAARLGILTASEFDRVMSPKARKPSASIAGLVTEKAAEWALGCPLEDFSSGMTERGQEMEEEAVRFYAGEMGVEPMQVGLCLHDDLPVGASPDRLVGDDGLLEVKCPGPKAMVAYILNPNELRDEYAPQVQGQLWVTGRAWCDLYAYHPTLPPVRVRCARDEAFIKALAACAGEAVAQLDAAKARLLAAGVVPATPAADRAAEVAAEQEKQDAEFARALEANAAGDDTPNPEPEPLDMEQLPF